MDVLTTSISNSKKPMSSTTFTGVLARFHPEALAKVVSADQPLPLMLDGDVFTAAMDLLSADLGRRPTADEIKVAMCAILVRVTSLEFPLIEPSNRELSIVGYCQLICPEFGPNGIEL